MYPSFFFLYNKSKFFPPFYIGRGDENTHDITRFRLRLDSRAYIYYVLCDMNVDQNTKRVLSKMLSYYEKEKGKKSMVMVLAPV